MGGVATDSPPSLPRGPNGIPDHKQNNILHEDLVKKKKINAVTYSSDLCPPTGDHHDTSIKKLYVGKHKLVKNVCKSAFGSLLQ